MSQQPHILLVEDNSDDIFFLERAIHKVKPELELVVVNSGDEALTFLSSNYQHGEECKVRLSLILLDLNLPKLNGLVLLNVLKTHGWLRTLPVVVVSTSTEEVHEIESLALGAWEFMQKPLTTQKVAELLTKYLPQETAEDKQETRADSEAVSRYPSGQTSSAEGNASASKLTLHLTNNSHNRAS